MAGLFTMCSGFLLLFSLTVLCLLFRLNDTGLSFTGYNSSLVLVRKIDLNSSVTSINLEPVWHAGSAPVLDHNRHAPMIIASSLWDVDSVLLWCRPQNTYPFRPRQRRSITSVICSILLLLAGDVHLNPGPVSQSIILNFGYINICSARNKIASIHDLITDFSLDILALSETGLQADMPAAIKDDIAPVGYDVEHVHRPATANRPSGGGLALVLRDNLTVRPHPVSSTLMSCTFELQLLRVTSVLHPLSIVNVYRPPSTSVSAFCDELSETLVALSAATTDRLLLCGDLNCPGVDAVLVSPALADLFDTLSLCQHVNAPTRLNPDHLLDVIVTDPELQVRAVRVDAAGEISDHHLVVASLCIDKGVVRQPVPISYRRIKSIDVDEFERRLRGSSLFFASHHRRRLR